MTAPDVVAGGVPPHGFPRAGMNDRMLARAAGSRLLWTRHRARGRRKVPLACTGTVMMDFPGPGLIQAIIA